MYVCVYIFTLKHTLPEINIAAPTFLQLVLARSFSIPLLLINLCVFIFKMGVFIEYTWMQRRQQQTPRPT